MCTSTSSSASNKRSVPPRFPGVVPPAGSSKLVRFIVAVLVTVIAMVLLRVH